VLHPPVDAAGPPRAAVTEDGGAPVARGLAAGEGALLAAEDARGMCGTVHLVLDQSENQPYCAYLSQMLLHRR
jgi:hypothetical protein